MVDQLRLLGKSATVAQAAILAGLSSAKENTRLECLRYLEIA